MVLRLQEEDEPLRKRAVRFGIAAAIVFHVVLFFIVFPSYYEEASKTESPTHSEQTQGARGSRTRCDPG
jgi:hypothetical protein